MGAEIVYPLPPFFCRRIFLQFINPRFPILPYREHLESLQKAGTIKEFQMVQTLESNRHKKDKKRHLCVLLETGGWMRATYAGRFRYKDHQPIAFPVHDAGADAIHEWFTRAREHWAGLNSLLTRPRALVLYESSDHQIRAHEAQEAEDAGSSEDTTVFEMTQRVETAEDVVRSLMDLNDEAQEQEAGPSRGDERLKALVDPAEERQYIDADVKAQKVNDYTAPAIVRRLPRTLKRAKIVDSE